MVTRIGVLRDADTRIHLSRAEKFGPGDHLCLDRKAGHLSHSARRVSENSRSKSPIVVQGCSRVLRETSPWGLGRESWVGH